MGGRGASRRGGGGPSGGRGSTGNGVEGVTRSELDQIVNAQLASLPSNVRNVLDQHGVRFQVLDVDPLGGKVIRTGFYDQETKTVHLILETFKRPDSGGLPNAAMTALHEFGHAFDDARRVTSRLGYFDAVHSDRDRIKRLKFTASEREKLNFSRYQTEGERYAEIWAVAFAVNFGVGRPIPAYDWINSRRFRRAYREVLAFVQKETSQ